MKNDRALFEPKASFKIILTEDDEDDFYFFNLAISSLPGSFELLRTSNGIMLSSLLQSPIQFDAIFLDINMPYKNGIECLKEIRSNRSYDSTRVVMYSTSRYPKDIETCYMNGANFYLIKPSTFAFAVEQLKNLFSDSYFKINKRPSRSHFVVQSKEERGRLQRNTWAFNHAFEE